MNKIPDKLKFWWVGLLTLVLGLFVTGGYFFIFHNKGTDKWVKSADGFNLQVLRKGTWDLHYWFIFQTNSSESNEWKTIYTHYQEDPQPISESNIQVINENIGYFYFGKIYAVTIDKGKTWAFFEIEKNSKFKINNTRYSRIEKIKMNSDGSGTMTVLSVAETENLLTFHTTDFGQNWDEYKK